MTVDQYPSWGPFESDTHLFATQAVIVWKAEGGWHPTTVLARAGDGPIHTIAPWTQACFGAPHSSWEQIWDYLADRVRTGAGGDG
jgi:hypothetical protein